MAKTSLFLWQITATVVGRQPEPYQSWKLVNGYSDVSEDEEIYQRTFSIIAPIAEAATLWIKSLLSDLQDVSLKDPVIQPLDGIIYEVTDLTALLKDQ